MIRATSNTSHPFLTVGWGRMGYNWYWIAKSLSDGSLGDEEAMQETSIGFGQFCIEDQCIARIRNFQDVTWQYGNVYDVSNLPEGWMGATSVDLRVSPKVQELLLTRDKVGSLKPVVIRAKEVHAHSRRYRLVGMKLVREFKGWSMAFEHYSAWCLVSGVSYHFAMTAKLYSSCDQ